MLEHIRDVETGGPAFPQDATPGWSDLKPTHPAVRQMTWEDTESLLLFLKEQFTIEHNKPKEQQDETRLKMLRLTSIELHQQRILLNIERLKDSRK